MEFEFPWLDLMVLIPLLGAVWVGRQRDPDVARKHSLVACGLTLVCAAGAALDFAWLEAARDYDRWDLLVQFWGRPALVVDALNAPLLPLVSLLFLLTALATLRTKVRRFSFAGLLASEAIMLATFSCVEPWIIIGLLAAGTIPPWVEIYTRGKPVLMYGLHMILFVILLIVGQSLMAFDGETPIPSIIGVALLMSAVLLRSGIVPVHCWMTDLFEHASFGTALLFVTPMVGAYAAIRLVLPIAPDWALHAIAILSLITALYAAGMALVQREARRFFCYLFLSHSSLVFVGLEMVTPVGLTGALLVWLSVTISMAGFGLTLRAIESRTGSLSLDEFHGLYENTPRLAALFLITGLASIGFPGTIGFVGADLLVDGAVQVYPLVGIAIVLAAALNGLAVLQAYFRIFTGTRHLASIDLRNPLAERIAVIILIVLVIGGGLYPQPGVTSRYNVAAELVKLRRERFGPEPAAVEGGAIGLKAYAPDWR